MSDAGRGIVSRAEWHTWNGRAIAGVIFLGLLFVAVIVFFPFFFAFSSGLKSTTEVFDPGLLFPPNPLWNNYSVAWSRLNMLGMFKNSVIVATGAVVGRLLVSAMAAYSLSRLKPFGKGLIEVVVYATMTIPFVAYMVPLYVTLARVPILDISLVNKYIGLWIPYAASAFYIVVLKNTFDQIPDEIYDAAKIDGASEVPLFFSFTVPLSSSILIVLGLLTFVTVWGDFLLPLLILRDPSLQTVSVRLFNLTRQFPVNLHMAGAFMAMLPPTVVAIFLQRYMKGGITF